jgi:hypothetical protein
MFNPSLSFGTEVTIYEPWIGGNHDFKTALSYHLDIIIIQSVLLSQASKCRCQMHLIDKGVVHE